MALLPLHISSFGSGVSKKKREGKGNIPAHRVASLFLGSCVVTRSDGSIGCVVCRPVCNSHFQAGGDVRIRKKR